MTTWIESERELTAWLERRFPDERTVDERIRGRNRRRWLLPLVAYSVVWVGLSALLPDRPRLVTPPGAATSWGAVIWVAAAVLVVAGIVLLVRDRPGQHRSRVLEAPDSEQRKELLEELRGRREVVPGDEPVLERMARERASQRRAGWLCAGWALAFVPAEVVDPGGFTGLVRLLFVGAPIVVAYVLVRQAREGARYLDGVSRPG